MTCHFILYVRDQETSTRFYQQILDQAPTLQVPGMTEFQLLSGCILGLMPENGIKHLLGDMIEHPEKAKGIPRAELYLIVPEPEKYLKRAESAGGRTLSSIEMRSWGDKAGYIADLDGHVIAFASRS